MRGLDSGAGWVAATGAAVGAVSWARQIATPELAIQQTQPTASRPFVMRPSRLTGLNTAE
jgi:hypothetical protein